MIDVWKGGGREGRATNEDLTFSAAGGDGIGPRLPVRARQPARRSFTCENERAEEKEIMKPISFWLTVTDGRGREGGREGKRGGTTVWE